MPVALSQYKCYEYYQCHPDQLVQNITNANLNFGLYAQGNSRPVDLPLTQSATVNNIYYVGTEENPLRELSLFFFFSDLVDAGGEFAAAFSTRFEQNFTTTVIWNTFVIHFSFQLSSSSTQWLLAVATTSALVPMSS